MKTNSLQIIRDAFTALHEGGVLENRIDVDPATVLLGRGTELDSLGFVSVMTEIEDRLTTARGKETMLLFDDIHAFNADKSKLTAGTLASFIDRLTAGD
jgi:hypothetical protein